MSATEYMRHPYFRVQPTDRLLIEGVDSPVKCITWTSAQSLPHGRAGTRSGSVARNPANQRPARSNPKSALNRALAKLDLDDASTPVVSSVCRVPMSNQPSRMEMAARVPTTYGQLLVEWYIFLANTASASAASSRGLHRQAQRLPERTFQPSRRWNHARISRASQDIGPLHDAT